MALAAEIRAELARRTGLSQAEVAAAVFGQTQQWLSPRVLGHIAFTGGQIKRLGDYLKVDIVDWYDAAKKRCPDPAGAVLTDPHIGLPTPPNVARVLEMIPGGSDTSARIGRLFVVPSYAA